LAPARCVNVMNLTLLSEVHFAAFLRLYSHLHILFHILRCSEFCLGRYFSDGTLFNVFSYKGGYTLLNFFNWFLLERCSPLCLRCWFKWYLLFLLVDCGLLPLFRLWADSGLGVFVHCGLFFSLCECTLLSGIFSTNFFYSLLDLFTRHRMYVIRAVYTLLFFLLQFTALVLPTYSLYSSPKLVIS